MFSTLLIFFFTLSILIFFHELGHYLAARWFGVSVLCFSIGFGNSLIKFKDRHETEWIISAIPFGGYVKLQDSESVYSSIENSKQSSIIKKSFNQYPAIHRIIIVAAGPIFNFILSIILYSILNIVGTSKPEAILSKPLLGSIANSIGLEEGDRIKSINGSIIQSWEDARRKILNLIVSDDKNLDLKIETYLGSQNEYHFILNNRIIDFSIVDPVQEIGLSLLNKKRLMIQSVKIGGIANNFGLRNGDEIISINLIRYPNMKELVQLIQENTNQSLSLIIKRNNSYLPLSILVPYNKINMDEDFRYIDAHFSEKSRSVFIRHNFLKSIQHGILLTKENILFSLQVIEKMFCGKISWHNFSGPLSIGIYAKQTIQTSFSSYISYLALISISLGIINILPIPMLDGGYILYYFIEAVRGSPIQDRWIKIGQYLGLSILIILTGISLFSDILRLFELNL